MAITYDSCVFILIIIYYVYYTTSVSIHLYTYLLYVYICLISYGKNATLSLTGSSPWTVLGWASCGQIIGQIFGIHAYPSTSNAGELALLLGVSFIVLLVQRDLSITRHFAEFLRRSNNAFQDPIRPISLPNYSSTQSIGNHLSNNEIELVESGNGVNGV